MAFWRHFSYNLGIILNLILVKFVEAIILIGLVQDNFQFRDFMNAENHPIP
jgi:hypothetical protein